MRMSSLIRTLCGAPVAILAVVALQGAGVPAQAASAPAGRPADYRVDASMILNVRVGEAITIKRIDGKGNCVKDETNKTVEARGTRLVEVFGFLVKDTGSCRFEPSHSFFSVTVHHAGREVAKTDVALSEDGFVFRAGCASAGVNLHCRQADKLLLELTQTGEVLR
jgi:hypothetical protein